MKKLPNPRLIEGVIRLSQPRQENQSANPQVRSRFLSSHLLLCALVCLAFVVTLLLFPPLDIYQRNAAYFTFRLGEFLPALLLLSLAAFAVLLAATLLLPRRLGILLLTLLFAWTLGAYVQATNLSTGIGILDGQSVSLLHEGGAILSNALIWAALLALPFLLLFFFKKAWNVSLRFVSLLIAGMQLLILPFTYQGATFPYISNAYLSTEKIFELSEEENVVVFVLDGFDNEFLDIVTFDDPAYLEPLGGFTYYPNTTASYGRTFPAMPYLLTAVRPDYSVLFSTYMRRAHEEGSFLRDVQEAGFHTRVFTPLLQSAGDASFMEGEVDNVAYGRRAIDTPGLLRGWMTLSAYRYMPLALKSHFWMYTADFEDYVHIEEGEAYLMDDPKFYQALLAQGLSTQDEYRQFILYHLHGPHAPYTLDSDANYQPNGTNFKEQTRGSLHIVYEYLRQMKELGIFDYSTIIITADHGLGESRSYAEEKKTPTPVFFIKYAGETDEEPLRIHRGPVSHDDFHPTVMDAVGGDPARYPDGIPVYAIDEEEHRVRAFTHSYRDLIEVYNIYDNARDPDEWYLRETEATPYPFYQ